MDTTDKIEYLYDATGTKLAKRTSTANNPAVFEYYMGDVVMVRAYPIMAWNIEYLLTPEGRVDFGSGSPIYEYHLKDHLGNARVAYIAGTSGAADAVQEADYYPFGMKMASALYENNTNKYLYNGKELQEDFNLDWYDYGARYYMPDLGRWTVIDKKAELYPGFTPYHYCNNNPIIFVDPDGEDTYLIIYGAGYENAESKGMHGDQSESFRLNAEAHADKLRNSGTLADGDAVIVVRAASSYAFMQAVNKEYDSGKITELTTFSHGGPWGLSLGGENVVDDNITQEEQDKQLEDYDQREVNENNVNDINADNFTDDATVTINACYVGGSPVVKPKDSFGQKLANYLGGNRTVKAFTSGGGAEMKTKNGDGKTIIHDGEMIRRADRSTQKPRFTIFKKDKDPVTP
ncbi:MAG TPA: hypothetical protein DCQ26_01210 [Marinilabiliales bacterium]|nr:MAG: hypothetical protein A2W97_12050 [Bacteroidetes bacterium GWE2_40_63]HAM97206.1 hypothetical protein [Marinilabiliales bacterium]HBY52789.1 hypothetical protein [Marinilabiliales bacterium]